MSLCLAASYLEVLTFAVHMAPTSTIPSFTQAEKLHLMKCKPAVGPIRQCLDM